MALSRGIAFDHHTGNARDDSRGHIAFNDRIVVPKTIGGRIKHSRHQTAGNPVASNHHFARTGIRIFAVINGLPVEILFFVAQKDLRIFHVAADFESIDGNGTGGLGGTEPCKRGDDCRCRGIIALEFAKDFHDLDLTAGCNGASVEIVADIDAADIAIGTDRAAVHVAFDVETADAAGSKRADGNAAGACSGDDASAVGKCCQKRCAVAGVTDQIAADSHLFQFPLDGDGSAADIGGDVEFAKPTTELADERFSTGGCVPRLPMLNDLRQIFAVAIARHDPPERPANGHLPKIQIGRVDHPHVDRSIAAGERFGRD